MVDVTNQLAADVLEDHAWALGNFAFSPYGCASVLVVLWEGARGSSKGQIAHALRLPWDKDVTRVGFRDVHRHLRSYFTHEGYLSGMTLSKNGTALKPSFQRVLRFYGYDVDLAMGPQNDTAPQATTQSPTSQSSTSQSPTSQSPTSQSPTSQSPTSQSSTSQSPTSQSPTSQSPTSQSPTSQSPTSQSPTSQSPTSQSPTSQSPTSQSPTSQSPTSQSLTSQSPTTQSTSTTTTTGGSTKDGSDEGTSIVPMDTMTAHSSSQGEGAQEADGTTQTEHTTEHIIDADEKNDENTDLAEEHADENTDMVEEHADENTEENVEMPEEQTDENTDLAEEHADENTDMVEEHADENTEDNVEMPEEQTDENTEENVEMPEEQTNENTEMAEEHADENTEENVEMPEEQTDENTEMAEEHADENTEENVEMPEEQTDANTEMAEEQTDANTEMAEEQSDEKTEMTEGLTDEVTDDKTEESMEVEEKTEMANEKTEESTEKTEEMTAASGATPEAASSFLATAEGERKTTEALTSSGSTTPAPPAPPTEERLARKPWKGTEGRRARRRLTRSIAQHNEVSLPQLPFLVEGGGVEAAVPFMSFAAALPYAFVPRLDAHALEFPLDDARYRLLLLLPRGRRSLPHVARALRFHSLRAVCDVLRPRRVHALLPAFALRGFVSLTASLRQLGVWDVFDPQRADLSAMSDDRELFVRNVEQAIAVVIRDYVQLYDIQTRAGWARGAVRFQATHPFLFFVVDADTRVALVAGKMADPRTSRIH